MPATPVVKGLDEVEDLPLGVIAGLEGEAVKPIAFEGGEKALGDRVVPAIAFAAPCAIARGYSTAKASRLIKKAARGGAAFFALFLDVVPGKSRLFENRLLRPLL